MIAALLADIASGASTQLAAVVVKCLAVGGGLLVGYFLGGAIAWALDRWVFAQKAPQGLKKMVSYVTGIALALIVALIVFGEGGNGLFGSGGNQGDKPGTTTPDKDGKQAPTPPVQTPPKKDEVVPPKKDAVTPPKAADTVINVTVLGGPDVTDATDEPEETDKKQFYLTDESPAPKTFKKLKKYILAQRDKAKGTLGIVILLRPTNKPSLDPVHYSISQLTNWATGTAKVNVILPP